VVQVDDDLIIMSLDLDLFPVIRHGSVPSAVAFLPAGGGAARS